MSKNLYCTNNDCYKNNAKLKSVSYLIVHSPAVYPTIVRVESGSGGGWYKRWNKPGVEKLVHGFIDDTGVYEFAPATMACWHVGNSWGNANCIGYELCELDTKAEFDKVWKNAINHYATLCKKYGLSADKVVGHEEAHDKGFASNHGDPDPYFKRFGKNMKKFREEVAAILASKPVEPKKTAVNGTITILSEISVRKSYSFDDNAVIGKAYKDEKHQVVESAVVEGTTMYKTVNGKYITGASKYVSFQNGYDKKLSYSSHVQTYGDLTAVANGCVSGTVGESKRLEAVTINCNVPLEYRSHCQTYGWMPWKSNGQMTGTKNGAKRLEAIQIRRKDGGNIKYRVHMQGKGWGPWVKNGETAGTTGEARRVEAIQIVLE